jgi:hypothetical protein
MAGYYSQLAARPQMSLADIFNAAGWSRQARDARDRQTKLDELAAADRQFEQGMRMDQLDLQYRHQRSEEDRLQRSEAEAQKKQADALTAARAQRTAAVTARYGQMTPEMQAQARPVLERMMAGGQIDPVDFGQAQVAGPIGAAMYGIDEPKPHDPLPQDEISKRVELQFGFPRGTPQHQAKYAEIAKAEEAARLARARAIGGAKALPTSTATELADAGTAQTVLDDLLTSFEKNVPAGGMVDTAVSKGQSYLPNSDVANYGKEADVAAQVVGTFLEGGKLAEGDYGRYRSFMPQPGDTIETARRKVSAIKAMIEKRNTGRRETLGASGYKVPTQATPQPDRTAQLARLNALGAQFKAQGMDDDQARAAAVEAYHREQGGP